MTRSPCQLWILSCVLLLRCPMLSAQAAAPADRAAFEVATIAQNQSGQTKFSFGVRGGQYRIVNMPLRWIIGEAYQIRLADNRYQLVGGPESLMSARFDVVAKLPEGASPKDVPAMLRVLLAERFRLRVHSETRTSPVYALMVLAAGKLGPQMHASKYDCDAFSAGGGKPTDSNAPVDTRGRSLCISRSQPDFIQLRYAGPVSRLAQSLQAHVDRNVVDDTHLDGNYEWQLQFASPTAELAQMPGIFTAVREQLGVKLEPQDRPIEIVVIDSVQLPAPN